MKPINSVTVEAMPMLPDVGSLGRQRPPTLPSFTGEFAFCFSVMHSVLMAVSISIIPDSPESSIPLP